MIYAVLAILALAVVLFFYRKNQPAFLQKLGAAKGNSTNQVQGLHMLLAGSGMWAAAHWGGNLWYAYILITLFTAFMEFEFDPIFEPHAPGTPYTPDWDDMAFYQVGAILGRLALYIPHK